MMLSSKFLDFPKFPLHCCIYGCGFETLRKMLTKLLPSAEQFSSNHRRRQQWRRGRNNPWPHPWYDMDVVWDDPLQVLQVLTMHWWQWPHWPWSRQGQRRPQEVPSRLCTQGFQEVPSMVAICRSLPEDLYYKQGGGIRAFFSCMDPQTTLKHK